MATRIMTAPEDDSRALVAAFQKAGAPVRYTEYAKTEHNPSKVNRLTRTSIRAIHRGAS